MHHLFWELRSLVFRILGNHPSPRRLLELTALVFGVTLLNSCIEGEEEVWIEKDGSGRAQLEITAPTLLFQKFGGVEQVVADAKEGLAESTSISLDEIEFSSSGSKTSLRAAIHFDDARQLGTTLRAFRDPPSSPQKSDEEILFGATSVQVKFPEIRYQRELDIRSLVPPEGKNPLTLSLLGDSQITYKVHLPTKVKTHNADFISEDGQTIAWLIPVKDLLSSPQEMKFTAPIPKLALYLTLAVILLLSLIAVLLLLLSKRRRPPSPTKL